MLSMVSLMKCCVPGCSNQKSGKEERNALTFHNFPHPTKDAARHKKWVRAIATKKFAAKHPFEIYKQFRVCRKHFSDDCFNGACKRIMKSAVPTLHINRNLRTATTTTATYSAASGSGSRNVTSTMSGLNNNNTSSIDLPEKEQEFYELIYVNDELMPLDDIKDESTPTAIDMEIEEQPIMPTHNNKKFETEFSTRLIDIPGMGKRMCRIEKITEIRNNKKSRDAGIENQILSINIVSIFERAPLTEEYFKKWRTEFYEDSKNILAQNVCTRVDPFDVCLTRKGLETNQHVFNYKVPNEGKPITNQKNSGRCWIFATLNVIRLPFVKHMKIDEFEFSQGYLFYWDKIERCHYFLNNIVETAKRNELVTGRLVSFLLNDPTCDGGQWDMIVNLINKHGLMPKKCFPESFSCEASARMNCVLRSKLREYAKDLRNLVAENTSEENIKLKIRQQMNEIYNVVGICLGIPDETFKWEYYESDGKYKSIGPIKPLDFYEQYVKPVFNVDDKVCLVTDPRKTNPYNQVYTVDCLGNVVGGRPVLYNNQPVELLMQLVTESLKNGEAVWFGCEVSKRFAVKQGIEDLKIHDFKLVFGVDIQTTMHKADRLIYGESMMTHAMNFTAVSVDEKGNSTKFRVENSWGDDRGDKGYLIMSPEWFTEFVFEVVIDKKLVPSEIMEVFKLEPIVLPAWDPMGTLASNRGN